METGSNSSDIVPELLNDSISSDNTKREVTGGVKNNIAYYENLNRIINNNNKKSIEISNIKPNSENENTYRNKENNLSLINKELDASDSFKKDSQLECPDKDINALSNNDSNSLTDYDPNALTVNHSTDLTVTDSNNFTDNESNNFIFNDSTGLTLGVSNALPNKDQKALIVNDSNDLTRVSSFDSNYSYRRGPLSELNESRNFSDSDLMKFSTTNKIVPVSSRISSQSLGSCLSINGYDNSELHSESKLKPRQSLKEGVNHINTEGNVKNSMENLIVFFSDPKCIIGAVNYMDACQKLVMNSLQQQSAIEKVQYQMENCSVIEGSIKISHFKLELKKGYVFINKTYDNELKNIVHFYYAVLFVRSRGDLEMVSSSLYTIVPESDAKKYKLDHNQFIYIDICITFHNLHPHFEVLFHLYCMEINQKLYEKETKPSVFKKLFSLNGPAINDKTEDRLFWNVASFIMTAHRVRTKDQKWKAHIITNRQCIFKEFVYYSTIFSMSLSEQCRGSLNVYNEVTGVGNWCFCDCQLFTTSLCGWFSTGIDSEQSLSPDIVVPYHLIEDDAKICEYTVCCKPNTFYIRFKCADRPDLIPTCRRNLIDGSHIFIAEAPSSEEAEIWCRQINLVRMSFKQWTANIGQNKKIATSDIGITPVYT